MQVVRGSDVVAAGGEGGGGGGGSSSYGGGCDIGSYVTVSGA